MVYRSNRAKEGPIIYAGVKAMPLGFFGGGPIFGPWIARRKAQSFTPSAAGKNTEETGKKKNASGWKNLAKGSLKSSATSAPES